MRKSNVSSKPLTIDIIHKTKPGLPIVASQLDNSQPQPPF